MGTKQKFYAARPRTALTPGGMVRVTRELREMTQSELAKASGLTQGTVSAIESDRETLGIDRAERLARALRVHPAVLVWSNWNETLKNDASAAETMERKSSLREGRATLRRGPSAAKAQPAMRRARAS